MLKFLAFLAVVYLGGTFAMGYADGRDPRYSLIGSLPALENAAIRQDTPDWETVSPAFWIGVHLGGRAAD